MVLADIFPYNKDHIYFCNCDFTNKIANESLIFAPIFVLLNFHKCSNAN